LHPSSFWGMINDQSFGIVRSNIHRTTSFHRA
jgi:hypothetical protein